MSVNPALSVYGTADLLRFAAVQDVDIRVAGPGGETSAKALVVALAPGSGIVGSVGVDQTTPGTTNGVAPATAGMVSGVAAATDNASHQLIAGVAAKRIYGTAISLVNTSVTTVTVNFQDGSGGAVLWTAIVPAGGGYNLPAGGSPLFKTTAGNGLFFAASVGVTTLTANAAGIQI